MTKIHLLASLLALPAPALAQEVLFEFTGASPGDYFGVSIARGDFDGDGVPDLVIGAPLDDAGGVDAGQVTVRSGADGSLLARWNGAAAGERYGARVAVVPDVDGDGVSDILIGAPGAVIQSLTMGRLELRSGATGALLRVHDAVQYDHGFGEFLGSIGDLDGDGVEDYAANALWSWTDPFFGGAPNPAIAVAYSGATGLKLQAFGLDQVGAIVPVGDVDGNGFADFLVQKLVQFTAPVGQLRLNPGAVAVETFSYGVLALGAAADFDGNGLDDYVVVRGLGAGVQQIHVHGVGVGVVLGGILDPAAGYLGTQIRVVDARADLDGDGIPDLLVGMPGSSAGNFASGEARVLSGVDLSTRVRIVGAVERGELGTAALVLGDINGDGIADYAVSEPSPHAFPPLVPGRVRVYAGGTPTWVDLGWALAGGAGPPSLTGSGTLVVGSPVTLSVADAAPGMPALFVIGASAAPLALFGGFVGPSTDLVIGGLATDSNGALVLQSTWPAVVPPGTTTYWQAWIADPSAPLGVSATNTLAATSP